MLNLHQLQYFVAVVEGGSFAEAARNCYLTPAAVAKAVRALEREFSVTLVEVVGRTAAPTHAGNVLYRHAVAVLKRTSRLRQAMKSFAVSVERSESA